MTETLLALTIFREEFDTYFILFFVSLLFLKVFHWLIADRIEIVRRLSPPRNERALIDVSTDGASAGVVEIISYENYWTAYDSLGCRLVLPRFRCAISTQRGSFRHDHVRFRGQSCVRFCET